MGLADPYQSWVYSPGLIARSAIWSEYLGRLAETVRFDRVLVFSENSIRSAILGSSAFNPGDQKWYFVVGVDYSINTHHWILLGYHTISSDFNLFK